MRLTVVDLKERLVRHKDEVEKRLEKVDLEMQAWNKAVEEGLKHVAETDEFGVEMGEIFEASLEH